MSKYVVGDKVRITNLKVYIQYGADFCMPDMLKYSNMVVTVSDIVTEFGNVFYRIEEDKNEWYWTDEMFTKIEQKKLRNCVRVNVTSEQIEKLCTKYGLDFYKVTDMEVAELVTKILNNVSLDN